MLEVSHYLGNDAGDLPQMYVQSYMSRFPSNLIGLSTLPTCPDRHFPSVPGATIEIYNESIIAVDCHNIFTIDLSKIDSPGPPSQWRRMNHFPEKCLPVGFFHIKPKPT